MASTEYGGTEEAEVPLEEADVYKTTSSSNFVVVRRVRLFRSKFITFHNFEENEEDNKHWILTSQCDLSPRIAAEIRDKCTKHVRPRGQWAITTLVKPKSIGARGQAVRLYMFTLSWPTRWAAKGYTSFSFGFENLEEARHWHMRLSECLEAIRVEKAVASISASVPQSTLHNVAVGAAASGNSSSAGAVQHARVSVGNGVGSGAGAGAGAGVPVSGSSNRPSSGVVLAGPAAAAAVATGPELMKVSGVGRKDASGDGRGASPIGPAAAQVAAAAAGTTVSSSPPPSSPPPPTPPTTSSSPGGERQQRPLSSAKRALVYDSSAADAPPPPSPLPPSGSAHGSSFAATAAIAAASAAAGLQPPQDSPAALRAEKPKPKPPQHTVPLPSLPAAPPPPPSSTDSEGSYEELEDAIGNGTNLGGAPCRPCRSTSRGDVHHTKQRWVPYKQVNGVAIYHHPQNAGDAQAGVGGEFMVSTVVRGSPRRCLTALTSNCGTTSILGPAIVQEVLQRRQAVDDKEVQRIVVQAPGLAGVICAPRELVVETVLKTDETGPTLMLMFNSCEVPARFVERKAGEQLQQLLQEETELYQTASEGRQRSWWRRPVCARVRGGYTLAPLADSMGLDLSPEALVTCIIKVDLGGVCGERSWFRLVSGLAGWTDAFLERMLMAVTLLRDEVEQARFVIQPLNMVASSSRVKDRDRDGAASSVDLPGLTGAGPGRSIDNCMLNAAVGGAAAGVRRTLRMNTTAAAAAAAARAAVIGGRSRKEYERPNVVDAVAAGPDGSGAVAAASNTIEPPQQQLRGRVSGAAAADAGAGKLVEREEQEGGSGAGVEAGARGHYDEATGDGGGGSSGGGAGDLAAEAEAGNLDVGSGLMNISPRPVYETMDKVLDRMRSLSMLDPSVWDNLHQPGKDAPFKIRGPTYLKDRKKIPAGFSRFILGSMDVIQQPPGMLHEHVARFIPAIRQSGAPFSVVVHLVIPGTPLLGIVATFVTDRHPSKLATPPAQPMEDDHDWEPFDFVLHKYMNGSTHVRNHMLKLIPHIADGSWMIKQSVGTTPVILGKQLKTTYYETPQYIEIDIDISANNVASYVTGLVRGATRSLVIDMGFVLEGTTPWELPEALLGTLRLYHLDVRCAKLIDVSNELPIRPANMAPPPPLRGHPYTSSVPASVVSVSGSTPLAAAATEATIACSPGGGAATPGPASVGRKSVDYGASSGGAVTAAGGTGQSGSSCKLTGLGGSVGGALSGAGGAGGGVISAVASQHRRVSGLQGAESAPGNSPAAGPADGSPLRNGAAAANDTTTTTATTTTTTTTSFHCRSVSAHQTPSSPAPRSFTTVSTSGATAVASSTATPGDPFSTSSPRP